MLRMPHMHQEFIVGTARAEDGHGVGECVAWSVQDDVFNHHMRISMACLHTRVCVCV